MSSQLAVSTGQYTDKGRKRINQDFHGVLTPKEPLLTTKGIVVALADGISSSDVSQIASASSVQGFLSDYFCTSEALSVKKSVYQVLGSINSWLYSQGQNSPHRYDKDKGYVCTFSALVFKSTTAHIIHIGDTRIYLLRDGELKQITEDHRLWVSTEQSYLNRALGVSSHLDVDYDNLPLIEGDTFVLMTDGVYESVTDEFIVETINNADVSNSENELDQAAKTIIEEAYKQGSTDNLTIQIINIETLPNKSVDEVVQELTSLPFPPILEARAEFDGYTIVRSIHASSRSHVYLALDRMLDKSLDNEVSNRENDAATPVILKTPSTELQNNPEYLERFLLEEWVARRINNAHVLKPCLQTRSSNYLYIAMEYIEGQTLTQWMIDNPKPSLEIVRGIVEQIAKGLRAFHRLEMLHQDLRPENIMIDHSGVVKIIDFGAVKVAGLMEITSPLERSTMFGTAQYMAPEYFLGESGLFSSDLFSLGVITYQMLSGRLPYGAEVAKCKTRSAQNRLKYASVLNDDREIPAWIDTVLKKAVHPNPYKRYEELSEFLYGLRHPVATSLPMPLMERNPILFWKSVSLVLAISTLVLLVAQLY